MIFCFRCYTRTALYFGALGEFYATLYYLIPVTVSDLRSQRRRSAFSTRRASVSPGMSSFVGLGPSSRPTRFLRRRWNRLAKTMLHSKTDDDTIGGGHVMECASSTRA